MASYRRRGKTWSCYFYQTDPATGQRRQKSKGGFATRRDAVAWHTRNEADRLRGYQGTPDGLTVTQLVTLYLDSRPAGKPSPGSLARYRDSLRRYIDPHLGGVPVATLTSMQVQRWHNDLLARPLAASTVRHTHALLSAAIGMAVDNGMLLRNVCKLVSPPAVIPAQRDRLDADQARAFLAATDAHPLGLFYRVMLFTLARPGEMLALRWSDIDWQRSTIHIHRTRRKDANLKFFLGEGTKSRAGNRTIVIHAELLSRLRQHRARQNEHRLMYAELWHDNDLVFCRDSGTMLADTTIRRALHHLCAAAGVPRLAPHGVRHSGASLLVEMNVHIKAISERLGHSSISQTADVYLSVSEGLQRQITDQMARALDAG